MDEPLPGEAAGKFYNAIQAIDDRGTILGSYDKVHLVPFGEYVPGFLDALIRAVGLRQFVHIPGGFEPSAKRTTLAIPGLPPAAATICYEAIFPGDILADGPRPDLILNVTNDAWFGRHSGAVSALCPGPPCARSRKACLSLGQPTRESPQSSIRSVEL